MHCLSSSGKRRPDELTTAEAKRLIDEWAEMKVFYINVSGSRPVMSGRTSSLMDYRSTRIGSGFSTSGTLIDGDAAATGSPAAGDYLDRADQHRWRDR